MKINLTQFNVFIWTFYLLFIAVYFFLINEVIIGIIAFATYFLIVLLWVIISELEEIKEIIRSFKK